MKHEFLALGLQSVLRGYSFGHEVIDHGQPYLAHFALPSPNTNDVC